MATITEKQEWILAEERKLAANVATEIIEKPKLSIWMILVPVFFVYYFYRLQKFADGRKEFVEHFMISRKRAMDEAVLALTSGNQPDSLKLCQMSTVPQEIYPQYRKWLDVLIDHYMDMLAAKGNKVGDLFTAVYHNRTNFLLFINQLTTVEKQFNAALKPHLPDSIDDANEILDAMETHTAKWRRSRVDTIFGVKK